MSSPQNVRELLSAELPKLYAFAYQMCGSRKDAARFVEELCAHVARLDETKLLNDGDPGRALLGMMARNMEESLGRRSEHTFESLDNILRSDITRPIDLNSQGMSDDPTQIHVMMWELKRTCLTSVLGCLPPGVRLSFVLTDLAGLSPAEAAEMLGIKESAYRVRLTRARKRIEDYLAPRCFHVDRENPCTCSGRLMIALDAGFVKPPARSDDIPHEPHDAKGSQRDVGSLYRGLPRVKQPDVEIERLISTAGG
ncbi:RNA polymerase sigma subunit [Plesiocystis pacifica SIR-1]|uniref:RNA polymerase sigma subunit n=1 Tax=Plesiocystis pacifica SIR-1 TaxID=391625 RepID=A6GIC0_9BACT|nr:sigma-70 family RNA polymerase sigma factor [Plesiocystis pacifica]EDM74373.1 RNA polymerase sigma subunit [Plesiocystis pacifica SIR-1]